MFLHETTNHHRSAIASMKGPTQAPAIAPAVPTAKPEVVTDGEVEIHVSRPHRHALVHVPIHAIISGKKPAISEVRKAYPARRCICSFHIAGFFGLVSGDRRNDDHHVC